MIAVLVFFAIISVLWSRDDNFVDVMKGRNLPLLATNEGDEVDAIDVGETDDYSLFNEIQFRFHGKTLAFMLTVEPRRLWSARTC